jgi:hypothetical protein
MSCSRCARTDSASSAGGRREAFGEGAPPALESSLYDGTLDARLDALRQLCAAAEPRRRVGTNLHIHTNESFSVFRSPTEAVWQAVCEGLAVFGINDHYTCAGHNEFRRACAIARLPATFSMEAVAMDREAEAAGVLTNDPGNPGRTYLCAKGVTRIPADDEPAMQSLLAMRAALDRRHREMTAKLGDVFQARLGESAPTWDDVIALTPRGNATERHISKATAIRLRELAVDDADRAADLAASLTQAAAPDTSDDAALQNFLRSKLLKAGAPCYVAEDPGAFLSVEQMRDLFIGFGAIPTYPVLGNPITEGEKDIPALMDRLEGLGFYALEVIPHRNTKERMSEIIRAARDRSWPVFNGTEHNTPAAQPLLAPLSLAPDFLPWFDGSATVLLGHHAAVANGEPGFVDATGAPAITDPAERLEHFRRAGAEARQAIEGAV